MPNLVWATGGSATTAETVFTEVTGTFTFNDDDVRAVYIDWDDGTDPDGNFSNKKEYANFQWKETTEPQRAVEVRHTYTASGAFNPVVQCVNSAGFISRYYSSGAAASDSPSPYTNADTEDTWTPMGMSDGQATGIMKIENKTVKTGIDNSIFDEEGPKALQIAVAPTLSVTELAYLCETGAAATGKVEVDIKCVLNYGTRDGDGADVQTETGGERIITTLPVVLSGANLTGSVTGLRDVLKDGAHNLGTLESGAQVAQVLEVKYKNPKYMGSNPTAYTENEVYNRFKIFLTAYSNNLGKYVPVTYVTAGEPIKKANDPLRNVTLDFSQSRAKASNVSIESYRYDIGKSWFQSANAWGTGSATTFNDLTSGTSETKGTAYTYMPRPDGMLGNASYTVFNTSLPWDTNAASDTLEDQLAVDDFGRFYPQYHLTRLSAQPSGVGTTYYGSVSTITDNKPEVFRITPAVSWATTSDGSTAASLANSRIYPTKILDSGTNASRSKQYTTEAFNNTSGTSGLVTLSGMNTMTFYDVTAAARANANEYLLLMFDKKTNKIFFNMSPYADNIQSALGTDAAWNIAGVYYLALENKDTPYQNAYWQPLEFDDTTAINKEYRDTTNKKYINKKSSFSKSGYLSFDMPLDWGALNISGAMGGTYNSTTLPAATGNFSWGKATGSVGVAVESSVIGDYIPYTMTSNPIPDTVTDSDIGSFKYIFVATAGSSFVSGAYWITKDGADGYESSNDKIYLNLGENGNTTGLGITQGYIRRVNAYDILDGFSKVLYPSGGQATKLMNVGDDNQWTTPWNNTYMIDTGETVGAAIATAWADEKYLLKVVLSGTDAASTDVFPEIWNIFDATRGYGAIVKEIDDSAYNLNSLAITSDVSVGRSGNYYQAITRKGKVFIARVGTPIESVSFSSVALGNDSSATAFTDYGPSTLYGHLHKTRKLQAESVRVYWDEKQKDGTYVRFWGVITNINETHGTGGPSAIISYGFDMVVEEVALLDANFTLMTDIFTLGSVEDARDYT